MNSSAATPASNPAAANSQPQEVAIASPEGQNGTVNTETSPEAPVAKSWAYFVAGAIGGSTAAILTNPLDVLKTRLQSDFYQIQLATSRVARGVPALNTISFQRAAALHIRETFQILFAIPRAEGWSALFKGLGPSLVGVVPARAIYLYCYGNGKRIISQGINDGKEASWVHLLAAANAGIITGTATCPIWVIKTRLQLDKNEAKQRSGTGKSEHFRRYRNAMDCTLQTLRHEGIRGLYRGLGASYLGASENTIQFVVYERIKMSLALRERKFQESGRKKTAWDNIVNWTGTSFGAGTAKLFAAVITYPHEVLRTRLRQAPMADGNVKYTGLVQCARLVAHEEGIVAFYGGLVPHVLRTVPSAIIMFACYEGILRLLGSRTGI